MTIVMICLRYVCIPVDECNVFFQIIVHSLKIVLKEMKADAAPSLNTGCRLKAE